MKRRKLLKAKMMTVFRTLQMATTRFAAAVLLVFLFAAATLHAQSCQTSEQIEPARLELLKTAARHYFDLATKNDISALQASSVAGGAAEFSPISSASFGKLPPGAKASPRTIFLLDADADANAGTIPRAEFLCGTFGKSGQTPNSAVLVMTNLRPATYGIVVFDVEATAATSQPVTLALVVASASSNDQSESKKDDWKLAAAFSRPAHVAGHDAAWFAASGKQFQQKDQRHNAWLYFLAARRLASPLPFMSTLVTDKLYDAVRDTQSPDLPADDQSVTLAAGAAHYKLTGISAEDVSGDLDLVVRYEAADVSNTQKTYAQNVALIRALVAKFPEFRAAFAGVVARAVTPVGSDYGTLLRMKDIH
jgi:hypothetical protein